MSEILAAEIAKGLPSLLSTLVSNHLKRPSNNGKEHREENIRTFISPHIEATFKKCINIKTLLNPNEPVDFLSIYSAQKFDLSDNLIDQYGFVEAIKQSSNNYILTGTGGSGKSIFTKYLWLSLFNDSNGKIPLFIELRNLNVSSPDLVSFLRNTVTQGKATIS